MKKIDIVMLSNKIEYAFNKLHYFMSLPDDVKNKFNLYIFLHYDYKIDSYVYNNNKLSSLTTTIKLNPNYLSNARIQSYRIINKYSSENNMVVTLDDDDFIDIDFINNVYDTINNTNAKVIFERYEYLDYGDTCIKLTTDEFGYDLLDDFSNNKVSSYLHNVIFSNSIINEFIDKIPNNISMFEDQAIKYQIIKYANGTKNYIISDNIRYRYNRCNSKSTTNQCDFEYFKELYRSNLISLKTFDDIDLIKSKRLYNLSYISNKNSITKSQYNKCMKLFKKDIKELGLIEIEKQIIKGLKR